MSVEGFGLPTFSLQVVAGLDTLLVLVTLLSIPSLYNTIQSASVLRATRENDGVQIRASRIRDKTFLLLLPLATFIATFSLLWLMTLGLDALTVLISALCVALAVLAITFTIGWLSTKKNPDHGRITGIGWGRFIFVVGIQTTIAALLIARGAIGAYTLLSDTSLALARMHVVVTFQ